MPRQGITPIIVSYSVLISACEKGEEPRDAVNVCDAMLRQGINPDIVTYSVLTSACENAEGLHVVVNVCDAMPRQGTRPDIVTYSVLAQKGLWYPTAPWCGAGGCTGVSWEGTVHPPAPGRGVVPLLRLRRESGTTSLPRSAN